MEVADLEAEMYEVLFKCVVKYNPDNGASFNTFIWQAIYNRFRSILRFNSASKRRGVEIPCDPQVMTPEDQENGTSFNLEFYATAQDSNEASTEDTFFAILKASELMEDPRMQTRIRSARQFAHVPS
jgi:DNA-directed RNA polymerase specialized sigma subunit